MVKQIKRIGLTKLLVGAFYEFHAGIRTYLEEKAEESYGLAELLTRYDKSVRTLLDIINRRQGSLFTEELVKLDKKRDESVSAFFAQVDAYAKSPIETQNYHGKILQRVIAPYRGITKNEFNKETAQIWGMTVDLTSIDVGSSLTELKLVPLFNIMQDDNTAFEKMISQRVTDKTTLAKQDINTKEIRAEITALYNEIIQRLNAIAVLEPDYKIEYHVKWLNAYIDQYRLVISHMRPGGTGNEKRSEDTE